MEIHTEKGKEQRFIQREIKKMKGRGKKRLSYMDSGRCRRATVAGAAAF